MKTTCEAVREHLSLFLYGELTFAEEERLQAHLAECESCRTALAREERLHRALDEADVAIPDGLLVDARRDLRIRLQQQSQPAAGGFWMALRGWSAWKPALAAVVAVGAFFGGRATVTPKPEAQPFASKVRFVEQDPSGAGVRIGLDEIRPRVVSGSLEDESIRRLLIAAAKEPGDASVRVESVEMLCSRPQEAEIRDALVQAVEHDANAGVRAKALEGLKPFAKDARTREALTRVLLKDQDATVRAQAIDVLTSSRSQELVGPFQEMLLRERDEYVRQRMQRMLSEMRASPMF